MALWTLDRLRFWAAILGNADVIARADDLESRLAVRERRDGPTRRALAAAKRLGLLER